jgi:hypothetical protein
MAHFRREAKLWLAKVDQWAGDQPVPDLTAGLRGQDPGGVVR